MVETPPKFLPADSVFAIYLKKYITFKPNENRTVISFIVEKDGSQTNFKIMRNYSKETEEQLNKLKKNFPKWNPGLSSGKLVRTHYVLAFY